MRIVHLVPGLGNAFYCENCIKDVGLVRALRDLGHDVVLVPLYLPIMSDAGEVSGDTDVFFGAVSLYLREKFTFLGKLPQWLTRPLDSPLLLRLAARKAGTMSANGHENLTVSMLRGEHGRQAAELDRLVRWLRNGPDTDVVHVSNALLLGIAARIKSETGVSVVCSLQDEDTWINSMPDVHSSLVWRAIADKVGCVDAFVTVSEDYAQRIQRFLEVPRDKMHVVYPGVEIGDRKCAPVKCDPPTIGYLSRMSRCLGLDTLIDTFVKLKREEQFRGLRLKVAGGHAGDDLPFIEEAKRTIASAGFDRDVEFGLPFDQETRLKMLATLDIMSVPVLGDAAFGLFIMDALASGVPVVQPRRGAFPEIVESSGGGILYDPDATDALELALRELLDDPDKARKLGRRGQQRVLERFTTRAMAERVMPVYERAAFPRKDDHA